MLASVLAVASAAAVPSPAVADARSPRAVLQAQAPDGSSPGAALEEWAAQTRRLLDALQGAAQPWTDALGAYLAEPEAYHPPQTLPNGDIVIRRRAAPPDAPTEDGAPEAPPPPLNL